MNQSSSTADPLLPLTSSASDTDAGNRTSLLHSRPTLSSEALLVLVSFWFVAICNTGFWSVLLAGRDLASWPTVRLMITTAVVLVAGNVLLLLPLSFRPLLKPVLTLHLVGSALTVWFITQLHVYVDTSMIRNVLQTDTGEVSELISWSMIFGVFVLGVLPAIAVWIVNVPKLPFGRSLRRKLILGGMALVALAAAALSSFGDYSSFFRNNHEARYLVTPGNYVVSLIRAGLESSHDVTVRTEVGKDATLGTAWQSTDKPAVFVIVVGETARAASFSLDGYSRDTNPLLRHEEVVNFTRVEACGTSTADSLPCLFSPFAHDDYDASKGRSYEGLLDVISHAGLPVIWLDNNSGCKGACSGVESEDLSGAGRETICNGGECFDEILLARTGEIMATLDRDMVIVLHQKGSHGPAYSKRYPDAFERFRPACESSDFGDCTREEVRNAYDNSILYTDYVLGSLIEQLRASSDRFDTAMLYVSDHGESLGEGGLYLHGLPYAIAPEVQKHVPMLMWISDDYATRFGIDRDQLLLSRNEKLSHDNVFHTVLGMLDIETAVHDPALDLVARAN